MSNNRNEEDEFRKQMNHFHTLSSHALLDAISDMDYPKVTANIKNKITPKIWLN